MSVVCRIETFNVTQVRLKLTLLQCPALPQPCVLHSPIPSHSIEKDILFNLIAVTEQFALDLHYIVDNVEVSDTIVGSPPTVGDWLNLRQFAIVWIFHSAL